jgi:hypothetical protein
MQTTTTNTEVTPVQVGRDQAYWEKKKVTFEETECIPFGMSGSCGLPYKTWRAVYKNEVIDGGCPSIVELIEWMNSRHDKTVERIKKKDAFIKRFGSK